MIHKIWVTVLPNDGRCWGLERCSIKSSNGEKPIIPSKHSWHSFTWCKKSLLLKSPVQNKLLCNRSHGDPQINEPHDKMQQKFSATNKVISQQIMQRDIFKATASLQKDQHNIIYLYTLYFPLYFLSYIFVCTCTDLVSLQHISI